MPKPRVLVVEDEPLIRELIMETLIEAGYEVDDAANADDARALVEADGYQLLVTDVNMPGQLDGMALAELAHDHDPLIAVVIVSARPDLVRPLRKSGIPGTFLPKPFTLEELVQVAARYVEPQPQ